jgi:hypothetical protein
VILSLREILDQDIEELFHHNQPGLFARQHSAPHLLTKESPGAARVST